MKEDSIIHLFSFVLNYIYPRTPSIFTCTPTPKLCADFVPHHVVNYMILDPPLMFECHYKKRGYPSVLKSAGIAPKSAGIGSKFLSRRFFSRRFKPLLFECGERVVRTCTSTFQKRGDRSRRFQTLFRHF